MTLSRSEDKHSEDAAGHKQRSNQEVVSAVTIFKVPLSSSLHERLFLIHRSSPTLLEMDRVHFLFYFVDVCDLVCCQLDFGFESEFVSLTCLVWTHPPECKFTFLHFNKCLNCSRPVLDPFSVVSSGVILQGSLFQQLISPW